jgi:hypothetical protein
METTRHACAKSYRAYIDATAVVAGKVSALLEQRRVQIEFVKAHFGRLWIEAMISHAGASPEIRRFL